MFFGMMSLKLTVSCCVYRSEIHLQIGPIFCSCLNVMVAPHSSVRRHFLPPRPDVLQESRAPVNVLV